MSSAIAAAKRRRAVPEQVSRNNSIISTPTPIPPSPPNKPVTINEFIMNLDNKLNSLETNTNSVIQEYESRFTMLAEEIADIKDVIIKLQSFSMEINKDLHNERIRILSDIENTTDNIIESIDNVIIENIDDNNILLENTITQETIQENDNDNIEESELESNNVTFS
tara:strand:- start:77 stop:577 length:501 start_codon:yes stop_codon:yes gene_type:complete